VKDALITTWSHWVNLGIIEKSYLQQFGLEIPPLDALTENSKQKNIEEIKALTPLIESINRNPELSQSLYPTLVFFGSRLKGYGRFGADLDAAIFIKPDFPWEKRDELLENLNQILDTKKFDHLTEFWLDDDGDQLKVKNVPLVNNNIAEPDWAHILFLGTWFGKKEPTKELFGKLISHYIKTENERRDSVDNRTIWLREMEREVLQYRLMHKGYARFYPKLGGIQTEHSDSIDSQSDFYDPGFRRIATKLFVNKVFLPQIK
jgi:hypothetical protein